MDSPSIIEVEVLVKEPRDSDFHPPIGVCHPKYWKLKSMNAQQARRLQVKYSGWRRRHINQVIKEFQESFTDKGTGNLEIAKSGKLKGWFGLSKSNNKKTTKYF